MIREQHRMKNTPEYTVWQGIKARCYNPNNKAYKYYGGRGITVCDKWKNSFTAFYNDMGTKPFDNAELDREENDGNYEPDNCHWVTHTENQHNTRRNVLNWFVVRSIRRLYTMKKYTTKQLCLIYNLKYRTVQSVIYNQHWKE